MTRFKFGTVAMMSQNEDVKAFKKTIEGILSLLLDLSQHKGNVFPFDSELEIEFETDGTAFRVEKSGVIQRLYYDKELVAEYNPGRDTNLVVYQARLDPVLEALQLAEDKRVEAARKALREPQTTTSLADSSAPLLEDGDEFIDEFTFGKNPQNNKFGLGQFIDSINSIFPFDSLAGMFKYEDEGQLQFNTSGTLFHVTKDEYNAQRLYLRQRVIANFDPLIAGEPLAFWQEELDAELAQLAMPQTKHAFSLLKSGTATTSVHSGAILPNNTAAPSPNSSLLWLLKVLASSALIAGLALILIGTWGGGLVPILGGSATAVKLGLGGFATGGVMLSIGLFGGRRDDEPREQQASCFSSCFPG
jgi:hypothetical protein